MCIFTDGYKGELRVSSTRELYQRVMELFSMFNPAKQIHLMQQLCNSFDAATLQLFTIRASILPDSWSYASLSVSTHETAKEHTTFINY